MVRKLQVRVISPWFQEMETDEVFFSVKIHAETADALLCDWAPAPELFTFPRRKAWYCCEPKSQFCELGSGKWPSIRSRMPPNEFLFHANPETRCRVPHVTHLESPIVIHREKRQERAVAVVSNFGGPPWRRHRDTRLRNRFVTHPRVDLFGRKGWMRYRASWHAMPDAPKNYKGELPGDWPMPEKRELMARYKAAICLENTIEPHYFTEKFVEAVCAGCIPIYHAHPTVAQTILRDAKWVDPGDYGNDPAATIAAALSLDASRVREQNEHWVTSAIVAETNVRNIFGKIGRILCA
jgi:hypothetical protein